MPRKLDLNVLAITARELKQQLQDAYDNEILITILHKDRSTPVYAGGNIFSGASLSDELSQRMARFSMKHRDKIGKPPQLLDRRFWYQGRYLRTGAGIITFCWVPNRNQVAHKLKTAENEDFQELLDKMLKRNMCMKR